LKHADQREAAAILRRFLVLADDLSDSVRAYLEGWADALDYDASARRKPPRS